MKLHEVGGLYNAITTLSPTAIFDAFRGTGLATDPAREQLLKPVITITNADRSNATVEFTFPEEEDSKVPPPIITVSEYQIVRHDTLILQFYISDGITKALYQINKNHKKNTWGGSYIPEGSTKPLYIMEGTIIIKK